MDTGSVYRRDPRGRSMAPRSVQHLREDMRRLARLRRAIEIDARIDPAVAALAFEQIDALVRTLLRILAETPLSTTTLDWVRRTKMEIEAGITIKEKRRFKEAIRDAPNEDQRGALIDMWRLYVRIKREQKKTAPARGETSLPAPSLDHG